MHPAHYFLRPLPEPLAGLAELALDVRWSWNHSADALWRTIDPALWEATANPWLILESVSRKRLEKLAEDSDFLDQLGWQRRARSDYLAQSAWFSETAHRDVLATVAYFSMEFGLTEALPIYSGGLGILSGDHLKASSDLGVPLVGVGLLYQQGYFRQALDANGEQLAFYPYNDPTMLPVVPLRGEDGEWVRVAVELPGRTVQLRAWSVQVGRVFLYLLDTNDPLNAPGDRGITGELYGGGPEVRLQQEIVLGIGGWRLLEAMGLRCDVCHLNEGHAAFAVLERARSWMHRIGRAFPVALRCTRAGNIFTTHTPVAAGFDRFPADMMQRYFREYAAELGIDMRELLALGRARPEDGAEPFNMAYLALRACGRANGVSRLHGAVSRKLFQPLFARWPVREVPVGHVTNGVHVPTWDSAAADRLWTEACGKGRWLGTMDSLERDLSSLSDEALWAFRSQGRRALLNCVRARAARQRAACGVDPRGVAECAHWLDPNALTMGFARRFAAYKRPNLLLHDRERFARLLGNRERPVQLVIAGKAHPADGEGKRLVSEWSESLAQRDLHGRAVFLEDYDMALAAELVQGVDLWINTPRRPWEASGTSGMKVLVNGGLNLSELDGWWAEAYSPDAGWAVGDGREHDNDPSWDAAEAAQLYRLLEEEVVPAFYTRNERGIPTGWVARMRKSMARLTPHFSTNRMVREYTERYYLPSALAQRKRLEGGAKIAGDLEGWHQSLIEHWDGVRFGAVEVTEAQGAHAFQVQVYLGDLDSEAVRVELYAEEREETEALPQLMERGEALAGATNAYLYRATVPSARPATDYTPRVVPYHPEACVPLECNQILWPG